MPSTDLYPEIPAPPEGRVTWQHIEVIAVYNPMVRRAMEKVRRSEWTRTEALRYVCFHLYNQNGRLMRYLVERIQHSTKTPVALPRVETRDDFMKWAADHQQAVGEAHAPDFSNAPLPSGMPNTPERALRTVSNMATSIKVVAGDAHTGFMRSGASRRLFGNAGDPQWIYDLGVRLHKAYDILMEHIADLNAEIDNRKPGNL